MMTFRVGWQKLNGVFSVAWRKHNGVRPITTCEIVQGYVSWRVGDFMHRVLLDASKCSFISTCANQIKKF